MVQENAQAVNRNRPGYQKAEAILREGLAAIDGGNYVPKETLSSSLLVTWKALTFTTAA